MYISQITISGFRNFKENCKVNFKEGVNVVIGHNNSGKSNLIQALGLVLNTNSPRKIEVDDFSKNLTIDDIKKAPPKIEISLTFTESEKEEEFSEDLVTVSTWLTKLENPYQATLTYIFYLPKKEEEDYRKSMEIIGSADINDYWLTIKHQFLKKYKSKLYGGDPLLKTIADPEALRKIDFQFLDAIRDVNRDLFSGRNTLLREVIDFFMDFDIKSSKDSKEEQLKKISDKKREFSKEAQKLILSLKERMQAGKPEMLNYANQTGASFGNTKLDFDGHILDSEMYSALKLIVQHTTGIIIPATHNGLGYNNLIFMSLLLAKMQKDASGDYLGSNAKVFPVLAIEEPEAHLHPAMQYKFLKFLRENSKGKARQIFITTHSPSITAAVNLDDIICLSRSEADHLNVGYLGKVFTTNSEDTKSKAYVQRFLDATKSDMLFAKGIILVEGITEQLTMSVFAQYVGKNYDLESNHISVINVGGRYFKHFLKLFDSNNENTIIKKVVCITDLDPVRRKKDNSHFETCYPFELNTNVEYEYNDCSNELVNEYNIDTAGIPIHKNIACFSQDMGIGKTFEYALAFDNPSCDILITDSIKNGEELRKLFGLHKEGKNFEDFEKEHSKYGDENQRILSALNACSIANKEKHLIASRYLNSLSKGENAFELANALKENLLENKSEFKVPGYIKSAIEWVCR